MFDHALRYIAPGAVPLTLPNRQLSSLEESWILVDGLDLLLDVLGVSPETG